MADRPTVDDTAHCTMPNVIPGKDLTKLDSIAKHQPMQNTFPPIYQHAMLKFYVIR